MILKKITLLSVFLFFMVSCACAEAQSAQESDQQISDFSLSGFGDKGKKNWDLSGKSADIFDEVIKLKEVVGNLYGKEEDVKLTADQGDFNKVEGKVHLEQNVVITTSSGAKLLTDSLDWDRKNQKVSTKDIVNIERDNMTTVASGAIGQPNLNQVTLEKEVTTKINTAQAEGEKSKTGEDETVITCDGPLQIDYEKNIATFNNNVKVDRGDSQIYSDVMDVYFASGDKGGAGVSEKSAGITGSKIKKIYCKGSVKIVRGENTSYSDEAIYTASEKKITLLGRPKLIIKSTQDLGDALGK